VTPNGQGHDAKMVEDLGNRANTLMQIIFLTNQIMMIIIIIVF